MRGEALCEFINVAKQLALDDCLLQSEVTTILTPFATEAFQEDKKLEGLSSKHKWDQETGSFQGPVDIQRLKLDLLFY